MTHILVDIAACTAAAISLVFIYLYQWRRRYPLPPGPKGLPIIGNVFDIPDTKQWVKYAQWSQDYGSPVIHLNILGKDLVVINDYETAQEALDKRSEIYSSRPRMPMLHEALGASYMFVNMPVGEKWRACRREFNNRFRQSTMQQFRPHEIRMTLQLLGKLIDTPQDFMRHFEYMTGSFILDFAYGIKADPVDDKYLEIMRRGLAGAEKAADKNIIDILPWIQHVPSWLPFMGWKKQIDLDREDIIATCDAPFEYVKEHLETTKARSCLATDLLSKMEDRPSDPNWKEGIIKSVCATAFVAASDTTIAALNTMALVMMMFPDIQHKAQEQIDHVIGKSRLPEFSDQSELPYITAIIKEVLRYNAVLPIAVPHTNTEDDILHGYYVPKGAIVIGNSWAILNDPKAYPEPQRFNPERFLTPSGTLDPTVRSPDVVFGFGRRICPGRFVALDTLWIVTACLLASFNFSKPKDLDIEPSADLFISGFISHPHPFRCTITPRSKEAVGLIHSSLLALED